MTISITHQFVSLKGDGTDATQVQPSNWNASHSFTLASGKLVGRLSAGSGAAEEIAISSYMAGLLNTADAATLAGVLGLFETGDIKYTFKTTASSGWLLLTGTTLTIGNASSGAALRANADTFALFSLIYGACSDALAPVSGGRSGNATTDFNANKTIAIPNLIGRVPVGAGAAQSWATIKTLGTPGGEETHLLTTAEMPTHYHQAGISDPGHNHTVNAGASTGGGGSTFFINVAASATSTNTTGVRVNSPNGLDTTYSTGGGGAHNVLQPYMPMNVMVKL